VLAAFSLDVAPRGFTVALRLFRISFRAGAPAAGCCGVLAPRAVLMRRLKGLACLLCEWRLGERGGRRRRAASML